MAGFFCKNNSLNPLRFSLAREIDKNKAEQFCKPSIFLIIKLTKTLILPSFKWLFLYKYNFFHSRIEVLQNYFTFIVSVSLARENLKRLRELFLQKNQHGPAWAVIEILLP